jgi:toxin ParE1/3/4
VTSYKLSRKAQSDLSDIWDYTARHWGLEQASRYVRSIATACDDIAAQRIAGRAADEVRAGYRKWPVGSHVIFYRTDGQTLVVIRILHKRMDVPRHL